MTPLAWIFMLASVSSVTVLVIWCFKRVLTAPEKTPEQMKDFHNA